MRGAPAAAVATALEPAKLAAFPPGECIGQEGFTTAREVRELARRAAIETDDEVLDVCCGLGGPGRLVAAQSGCRYLGVDREPVAVEAARRAVDGLPCRYEVGRVPPLPAGPFDVVLLLETLLAFRDKQPLLAAVAAALPPGGRFVLTVEAGAPLTSAEQAAMPASDTVWPVELPALRRALARQGLAVTWEQECTSEHQSVAAALAEAYDADQRAIGGLIGEAAVDDLVTAHRLWADWLGSGRIRKYGMIAVRVNPAAPPAVPAQ